MNHTLKKFKYWTKMRSPCNLKINYWKFGHNEKDDRRNESQFSFIRHYKRDLWSSIYWIDAWINRPGNFYQLLSIEWFILNFDLSVDQSNSYYVLYIWFKIFIRKTASKTSTDMIMEISCTEVGCFRLVFTFWFIWRKDYSQKKAKINKA